MPIINDTSSPRFVFVNDDAIYENLLRRKRKLTLRQYTTPTIPDLRRRLNSANIETVPHIWKTGDRYYKLALQYYNNSSLWWVIAIYNQKPTEGSLRKGDVLLVPVPIETVLYFI